MGFQPSKLIGDVPEDPHLALMTEDGWGAVPLGARFLIVTDPDRVDRIIPVFLIHVGRKNLKFRCNCGNPHCTRVLNYQLRVEGRHPTTANVAHETPET